jgi:hypothetical protein
MRAIIGRFPFNDVLAVLKTASTTSSQLRAADSPRAILLLERLFTGQ